MMIIISVDIDDNITGKTLMGGSNNTRVCVIVTDVKVVVES